MTMTDKQRPVVPPTEVRPKGEQRTVSAEFKRGILAEVDACTKPGAIGAVLRSEGLFSSWCQEARSNREILMGNTSVALPTARLSHPMTDTRQRRQGK